MTRKILLKVILEHNFLFVGDCLFYFIFTTEKETN